MHNILVLNAKGGCGKTTIATTLACYFAGQGYSTALMDFDPQNSSSHWLKIRPADQPPIRSIDATRTRTGMTRTWQLYSGNETEVVVIDTPAGVTGGQLFDLYNRADSIIIPIMPTVIDTHAAERFLKELMRVARHRLTGKQLGLIANRIRLKTHGFSEIETLSEEMDIPLIASLRDTQNYSIAMESGLGICELNPDISSSDREQWNPILEWLHQQLPEKPRSAAKTPTEQPAQKEDSEWKADVHPMIVSR